MKQTTEVLSTTTTTADGVTCNGHEQASVDQRQSSDNEETNSDAIVSSTVDDTTAASSSKIVTTNDMIVLPELSFNVRIQCSGVETFELPVTSSELVQEIHQVLMDKEETCHRTCFSLQLDGIILDNFTELKNIENLKEGSLLKVVEGLLMTRFVCFAFVTFELLEQYTVREVRIHVKHVNELIHACDPVDLYNGVNGYSLCLVNEVTSGDLSPTFGTQK